jgi:hypothetical protein
MPGAISRNSTSELTVDPGKTTILERLERAVFDYFSSLQLPDEPTLYDHLVLSLRPKDVIATFNWDPFLIPDRTPWRVGEGRRPLILYAALVLRVRCHEAPEIMLGFWRAR